MDSWIDELDEDHVEDPSEMLSGGMNHHAIMGWMIQQYLPKMKLPHFDGSPIDWVPFIVKFRDVVHRQKYLFNEQRSYLLMQHLKGEPERAIRSYVNDPFGYVLSLKKLKRLFGQRSEVARAVLEKAIKGKVIQKENLKGLSELSYSINDCLTTLRQMNYESDLNSSDTLPQVLNRLP